MPWLVFDKIWRHKSYQVPLLSDRLSDLVFFTNTININKLCLNTDTCIFLYIPFKGSYKGPIKKQATALKAL